MKALLDQGNGRDQRGTVLRRHWKRGEAKSEKRIASEIKKVNGSQGNGRQEYDGKENKIQGLKFRGCRSRQDILRKFLRFETGVLRVYNNLF